MNKKNKRVYVICMPNNSEALIVDTDDEVIDYLRDQWGSEYAEEYENGSLSSYTDSIYVVETTIKVPSISTGKSEWEEYI